MSPTVQRKSLLSLLFSPHGRIGRASYLRGVAIVMLLDLGLCIAFVTHPERAWLAYPAMLLTLPVTVAVTTKRLHAIGRSGWFQAPARALAILCIAMASAGYLRDSAPTPPTLWAVVVNFVPSLVLDLALFAWLIIARTRPQSGPVAEVFD